MQENEENLFQNEAEEPRTDAVNEDSEIRGRTFDFSVLLVDAWKGLKKFWWIMVALSVLLSSYGYMSFKKSYVPIYQAEAQFSIKTMSTSGVGTTSYSYTYHLISSQMSTTFPYIIQSTLMNDIIKSDLGVSDLNASISSSSVSSTNIFKISVQSGDPQRAYDVLQSLIENYPRISNYVIGYTSMTLITQPQVPTDPINVGGYRSAMVKNAFLGIALGLAVILLYAFSRNTVRKASDIKEKLNQKCLAEIPFVVTKKRNDKSDVLVSISQKYSSFSEAFRVLKKRTIDSLNGKTLAVTSTVSGEGKTTVAINLAHSLAKNECRVALVDLDIKKRSVQYYLNKNEEAIKGLADINFNPEKLDVIAQKAYNDYLTVFYAGNKDAEPNQVQIKALLARLKNDYDYVVVDTPPCGIVSKTGFIVDECDGALFVIRQDMCPIKRIKNAILYISESSTEIIGFVFNGVVAGFSGYGKYYGYGYSKYGYSKYGYSKYGNKYGRYGRYGKYGRYGYGNRGDGYGDSYGHGYGYGYGHGYGYGYGHGYGYGYGYGDGYGRSDTPSHSGKKSENKESDKLPKTGISKRKPKK